ncbi:PKD domain-containing protein [Marinilabilia rubra]|uniref:Flagellar motor protein MotB n=1 Tax=Marinilabilia rubra TaxID=2162893 RepID=A0A2U2BDN3_9BACT|nr:PKD domain-containing protein [Marinilabilia rubra]PWE01171.1 flagellar motor protein MotB [Marinilabilia rubra]
MSWEKPTIIYLALVLTLSLHVRAQKIEVTKLSINSPSSSEVAPVVKDSTLYFISNRRTSLLVTYMDQNEELLYRVFRAPLKPDTTLGKVTRFSPPSQPKLNAGPLTFSENGAEMIATHNQRRNFLGKKDRQTTNPLGLFLAKKSNGGWHRYQELQLNETQNQNTSFGHPSLSQDGRTLYFVSDMEGGQGQTDIYISKKTGESWSTPKNLGPFINTDGKELFPYVHPSGKLYFTSDGIDPTGGFNIYYIDLQNVKAGAVAMPSPINSVSDDFSCFVSRDESWGYFASNRSGQDDIYKFSLPRINCTDPTEIVTDNYCFTFFENGPFKSDTLPYIYRWNFGDDQTARGLEVDHCFSGPGDYDISLNVVDTLLNEELFSVASYNLKLERTQQIWFESPDTIQANKPINLSASLQGYPDSTTAYEFYWEFGDGETRIGKNIAYIYQNPGEYRITCSAVLNDNREVCFYRKIIVTDPQE